MSSKIHICPRRFASFSAKYLFFGQTSRQKVFFVNILNDVVSISYMLSCGKRYFLCKTLNFGAKKKREMEKVENH